jgi:hypothetical protein
MKKVVENQWKPRTSTCISRRKQFRSAATDIYSGMSGDCVTAKHSIFWQTFDVNYFCCRSYTRQKIVTLVATGW